MREFCRLRHISKIELRETIVGPYTCRRLPPELRLVCFFIAMGVVDGTYRHDFITNLTPGAEISN